MLQKQSLYLQVYQSLEARIYSGSYARGDRLSSISELAQEYGVADNTIRAALKLLCQQELIRTDKGSGIYVQYDRGKLLDPDKFIPWLAARRDGVADICYMHQLFMPRIICCAARLLNDEDIDELARIADEHQEPEATTQEIARTLRHYVLRLLAPLKNHTLARIYSSANDYIRAPLLLDPGLGRLKPEYQQKSRYYLRRSLKLLRDKDMPRLYRLVSRAYAHTSELFQRRANQLCAGYSGTERQPFRFALCQEDHFRYGRVANALLTDIISGHFSINSYLPPASALCSRYNASLITVRRAVAMLNGYGFTRSVNGVGTLVIIGRQAPESSQEVCAVAPEEIKLSAECLQILSLCLNSFADLEIKRKDDAELKLMYERLTAVTANGERLGAWVVSVPLDVMINHAGCQAARLIYPQLTARIMLASRNNYPYAGPYRDRYDRMQSLACQAAGDILRHDAVGFCRRLQEVIQIGCGLILEPLQGAGIEPDMPLLEPQLLAMPLL